MDDNLLRIQKSKPIRTVFFVLMRVFFFLQETVIVFSSHLVIYMNGTPLDGNSSRKKTNKFWEDYQEKN